MTQRALVIEGGGMKAAYANGILTAFERADYHPWDAVIGTSAGGAMAAWYSAGQAEFAEGTWKYAADKRIINYQRAFTGRGPLLDHEALWFDVYENEHPLDIEAVKAAQWPVVVTVADTMTGDIIYVDVRGQKDPGAWIRATGRLPFASGPAVEIDGRFFVDGGVIDPVPLQHAIDMGATDITLITNKPPGPQRPDPRMVVELASRKYPALRDGMQQHQALKQAAVALAQNPPDGVNVHHIHPSTPTPVSRLTRDLRRVNQALELGHVDGAAFVANRRA